jgi:hypothetical protein
MKIISWLLIAIIFLIFSYFLNNEFEVYKVINTESEGALCLDGSKYQFYLQDGFDEGKWKFLLFFEGGGWCSKKVYNSTLESCLKRMQTFLGSSSNSFSNKFTNFFGKFVLLKRISNYLSQDRQLNPDFYNWNKIIIKYCDGRGFVGYNKEPVYYKNKTLFFRGYNNTMSVLNFIKTNYNLNEIQNVIISGSSAGGHASLFYSNFISDFFTKNTKVATISDSGFFLDISNNEKPSYNFSMIWRDLLLETNPTIQFTDCTLKKKWKCLLPEYFYNSIRVPVFIIHSLYDSYTLCHLIGTCKLSIFKNLIENTVEKYEENRLKLLTIFKDIQNKKPNWGIYSPACPLHDFLIFSNSFDNKNVKISGFTLKESLSNWLSVKDNKSGIGNFQIDKLPWPGNIKCAHIKDTFYYIQYLEILTDIF